MLFDFDLACKDAFEKLKEALTSAPLLSHFDPERQSQLETDAIDEVVAAVLSQKNKDVWHPIAFFSKLCSKQKKSIPSRIACSDGSGGAQGKAKSRAIHNMLDSY